MALSLTYRPILKLDIWHGYAVHGPEKKEVKLEKPQQVECAQEAAKLGIYELSQYLQLVPSPETRQLMKKQRIHFHLTQTGMILYVQARKEVLESKSAEEGEPEPTVSTWKPFVNLDTSAELIFGLVPTHPHFAHISNALDDLSEKEVFYFSNTTEKLGTYKSWAYLSNEIYVGTKDQLERIADKLPLEIRNGSAFRGQNLLGIIHISADRDLGSFSLLNSDNELQHPHFVLWWANRLTQWRYLLDVGLETDSSLCNNSGMELLGEAPHYEIHTKECRPLVQGYHPIELLFLIKDPSDDEPKKVSFSLPNPDIMQLYKDTKDSEYHSKVYLGALNLKTILSI